MMKKILTVSALALLAGCSNMDGASKSAYAGLGTLVDAAVGAVGAVGAGTGYSASKQEYDLRRELEGSGVQVQRQNEDIRLVMPGAIAFSTGSSDVSAQARAALSTLAASLQHYPDTVIVVVGHTDNVGSLSLNNQLSRDRALSVTEFLAAQGVPAPRLQYLGAGPSQPVASNDTEQGRAQNRRVEIVLKAPAVVRPAREPGNYEFTPPPQPPRWCETYPNC